MTGFIALLDSLPKHINPCKNGRTYQTYFVPSLVLINVVPSGGFTIGPIGFT